VSRHLEEVKNKIFEKDVDALLVLNLEGSNKITNKVSVRFHRHFLSTAHYTKKAHNHHGFEVLGSG